VAPGRDATDNAIESWLGTSDRLFPCNAMVGS